MSKRSNITGKSEEKFEELTGESVSVPTTGDLIEYDPNVTAVPALDAENSMVEHGPGTLGVSADLIAARDEMEARLGGLSQIVSVIASGVDADGFGHENIMGVGIGPKRSAGGYTGELAVKVFVKEKVPVSAIRASALVPESVGGIATDVEVIGEIRAQTYTARYPRPVPCGVSCGHFKITAGTIGCMVVLNNNRLCILSNNHVLANENNAQIGDNILQPGRYDGGQNPQDRVAVLERFVRVNFPGPNLVDAAAAWTSQTLVRPRHITYRLNPTPLANPAIHLPVLKNGRTTQATTGMITAVHVNGVQVGYSSGVAVFNDQLIIQGIGGSSFSQGGDSGSLIVSAGTKQPVGLLFAGSSTHTIANPISAVISQLGIRNFVSG